MDHIRRDIASNPSITHVHELKIWRLNQECSIATAHIETKDTTLAAYMETTKHVEACLQLYGVHAIALQPIIRYSDDTMLRELSEDLSADSPGGIEESEILSSNGLKTAGEASNPVGFQ